MYKRVSGTKDILPKESFIWQAIEETSRKVFSLYNFEEIRPPLIEEAGLFNRSLGESAEIVKKQLFIIRNKDEDYALRPEGTASIVRSYIENNLDKTSSFSKLYYLGPMFRLERPQKGRLRQFNHIGCEAIGSYDASLDIEVISLADKLLRSLNITGYTIKINSLGCTKDKAKITASLRNKLQDKGEKLCDDCKDRLKNNALRILDCKKETCREIVKKAGLQDTCLCEECRVHFNAVKSGLDMLKIKYTVDPNLVRGLDYYTQTVFEITHGNLGSQDAIGAGGRYNNLVRQLEGPDVGAIGFALGIERLLLAKEIKETEKKETLAYVITLGKEAKEEGIKVLYALRENGISADMDYEGKSIKGAMRKSSDLKARFTLIIGEDEIKKGVITLKNMLSGEQREITRVDLTKELRC
ncbi:MAG: histidine--tRNA ligase [Candidatus Omnitrophica bacterium]|nr:histidine--tRNA ligase [Candidatus Omnitrophota bacterium]